MDFNSKTKVGSGKEYVKDCGGYPERFEKDGFEYYLLQHHNGVAMYTKYRKTVEVIVVGFLIVQGKQTWKFVTAGNYGGAYKKMDAKFYELAYPGL